MNIGTGIVCVFILFLFFITVQSCTEVKEAEDLHIKKETMTITCGDKQYKGYSVSIQPTANIWRIYTEPNNNYEDATLISGKDCIISGKGDVKTDSIYIN